jgi:hypothetical protein
MLLLVAAALAAIVTTWTVGGCTPARAVELASELSSPVIDAVAVEVAEVAEDPTATKYRPHGTVPHLCSRYPARCKVAPTDHDPRELGLVCCGDGWCMAINTNSECGASGEIFWCEHGESTMNEQGLPDVECYD